MSNAPQILWVDDDPYILSSVKRLLALHGLDILTTENPNDVVSIIESHAVSVVISDQRMPQMTGLELLKILKQKYPHITRLMVTGFFERSLLEEAINVAGVFRFITKPWGEAELVSDIKQALENSSQLQQRLVLNNEIKQQNNILLQFTDNLEQIILERTKETNQFNRDQEAKNKQTRDLVVYIQDIHHIDDLADLMSYFYKDIRSKFPILSAILCFKSKDGDQQILSNHKGDWTMQIVPTPWTPKSEIKINDKTEQQYLVNCLKRPVHKIVSLPFLKTKNSEMLQNVLFIEHDLSDLEIDNFINYITSRLQILSLAFGRIFYIQKIESDSKYWEQTFDSIKDPICIFDKLGKILKSNMQFQNLIQAISKAEEDLLDKTLEKKTLQKTTVKYHDEIYDVVCFPILESDQVLSHFVFYYRNITKERGIYEKMIQSEKMAALGLLAGNVAHELNNPLTGIRSFAQILKTDKNIRPEFLSDLEEIDKAAFRCQSIIQAFKDFSDTESELVDTSIIDINEVVHKTLPFLKTSLRQHNLKLKLSEKKIMVQANSQVLQQVLFNVIINACQAMQDAGSVEIRTSKKGISGVIEIEDTGQGIPKEIQDKIFEPFFTTKKDGVGTGLGLSFCKRALEKMNGSISFQAGNKKGTVFKIKLCHSVKKAIK